MRFAFITCLDPLRKFLDSLEEFGFWVALIFGILEFFVSDEARPSAVRIFLFGLILFFVSKFVCSLVPTTENALISYKIQLLVKDGKNQEAVEEMGKATGKAIGIKGTIEEEEDWRSPKK